MIGKDKSIKNLEEIKSRNKVDDKIKLKIDEKLKYVNKPLNK